MKKKRRLVTMAIFAFAIYKFITPPITYKIDSRLVEINDTLKVLSEEHGLKFLSIYSTHTSPVEFSDIIPAEVYGSIKKLNIRVVHFYNGAERQSAAFRADRFLFSLSPLWYYLYSDDGLTEEKIVPSIEDAVKQHRGAPYYGFCQEAEVPNWFYCTQDSGG